MLFKWPFNKKTPSQELETNPRTLEKFLEAHETGDPVRVGPGAAVIPLYVAKGYDLVLVTWEQAVRHRSIEIEATGGISDASITNTGRYPVLVPAGVVLIPQKEGEQPRMTIQTSIIPARTTIQTQNLSCLYQGGGTNSTPLDFGRQLYAFPSARVRSQTQQELWGHIENVASSGVFDDVRERNNLAALLYSGRYQEKANQYLDRLNSIPRNSGRGSILGHLVVYIDPQTRDLQVFLEGYGNSSLYISNEKGMAKGIAGQGAVSELAANSCGLDVVNEATPRRIEEIVSAFARTELNKPVSPAADYGTRVNAALYGSKVAHFEGSGNARK
ncbi:hypothetical protein HYU11_05695 [Candidatus Woesearchaeota archaeon]|nr:hypothetical protein [Candidatus Woesearchaeota archaeon]